MNKAKIFLISDNHFGDYDGPKSVIEIFDRKFDNSAQMNAKMMENWNTVVGPYDIVISLGDFAWLSYEMKKYADKLNGIKYFILGNHDFEGDRKWLKEVNFQDAIFPLMSIITYKNRDFVLVHRPEDVPYWWNGWVIHGHHHTMPEYPFIDGKKRNINVACELVNYTPVSLDWIVSMNIDKVKRMDSIESKPIKW